MIQTIKNVAKFASRDPKHKKQDDKIPDGGRREAPKPQCAGCGIGEGVGVKKKDWCLKCWPWG